MEGIRSKTPYEITLDGEAFYVLDKPTSRLEYLRDHPEQDPRRLGLIALGGFRKKSYVDYLAIASINDVDETESWIRVHEQYEWFDWMAGVVYKDQERKKQLNDMHRKLGEFVITFGWSPDYVLEDQPSEQEFESYINHVTSKDLVGGVLIVPQD